MAAFAPPPSRSPDALAGSIERVTFHNAESGFCVLKVKARGRRDLVAVIGHAPAVAAGEWVTATGAWISDREHGLQFRADTLAATPPTGVEGIARYLASGQMRGIGPEMAKRIVKAFGAETFAVIEAEPERLTEVSGIGPTRAARITAAWAEHKVVREIMVFLHAHGVGTARAVRIFKTYGTDSVRVMTEDPYRWPATCAASAFARRMPSRKGSACRRPPPSACAPASPTRSRRRWMTAIAPCRCRT